MADNARDEMLRLWCLPPGEVEKLPCAGLELARNFLLESPSELFPPTLSVYARSEASEPVGLYLFCLAVPFSGSRGKHEVMAALGVKMYQDRLFPAAVNLVSEAWSVLRKPGEAGGTPPSQCPDREEIIQSSALSACGKSFSARMPVTRGVGGALVPGDIGETLPCESNLLRWFYRGFFQATALKHRGVSLLGGLTTGSN